MKQISAYLVAFLISLTVFGCGVNSPTQTELPTVEGNQPGLKASDFTLIDLEGNSVSLSSYRGKPVLLNFWASWCGPCVIEMPEIERLGKEMGDQIQIIGINLEESSSLAKAFVESNGLTWTCLLDETGEVGRYYAVSAIPTSIFINAEGIIARRNVGTMNYEQFRQLAQETIAN